MMDSKTDECSTIGSIFVMIMLSPFLAVFASAILWVGWISWMGFWKLAIMLINGMWS